MTESQRIFYDWCLYRLEPLHKATVLAQILLLGNKNVEFHFVHIKAYTEQLFVNFQRTKPSKQVDHLIEVCASKHKTEI